MAAYTPARFRRLIEGRGLTLTEVARLAGMSRQQVHQVVGGSNPNPGIRVLERIAAAAGVGMAELFSDGDED